MEEALEKVRTETIDSDPLSHHYPTLFHHMTVTAGYLKAYTASDFDLFQSWYLDLKANLADKANKAAEIEVEETCCLWKSNEIDRHAIAMEAEIKEAAKKKIYPFFLAAAANFNLLTTPRTWSRRPQFPPPPLLSWYVKVLEFQSSPNWGLILLN